MRHLRPTVSTCLFSLFILLALSNVTVRADDDDDYDQYDETARVARVTLVRGDVQLRRDGSKSWETARVNFPLVEGDVLATTGADSRLEIQVDARNYVRLGGDSIVRVVTLRYEGVALSLSEGTMSLRLARFDKEKEYFEVDAPGTTLAAEKTGVYRLDVSRDGDVRLTVRDGGRARIYSETSGFTLRDGRSAELVRNGTDAGDWELSAVAGFDSWDQWVDERERYLTARLRYEGRERYYDSDVWGAEELDAYGEWVYTSDYGWIWRPYSNVVNNYSNWAPYRYGHWVWCPPYGWTWVGDEPWGWAPYHYGRWVYHNNSWCWAPRGYGYAYHRSWWRPALVVFVYVPTSYGERVCWYPLTHRQHDPRSRNYRRLEALHGGDLARLQRTNPAYLRAITSVPARDFGRRAARTQEATDEIARRAINAEPVRGRLPIAPVEGQPNGGERNERGPRVLAARPTSSAGSAGLTTLENRPTGAATRTPGMALDNELRRTRLYNGREPRPSTSSTESGGGNGVGGGNVGGFDPGSTGAVARPPRTRPASSQPVERGPQGDNGGSSTPWYERPARPGRVNPGASRPTSPVPSVEQPSAPPARSEEPAAPSPEPARRVRPPRPTRDDDDELTPRPVRVPESRPQPRPEPQPQPETRPEPRPEPRDERPSPRPEPRYERPEPRPAPRSEPREEPRSEPSRPEPRPEPRPETRPEPRQEPRQEPRSDPPPRHEEPRQSPPPQRERKDDDAPARPTRRGDDRQSRDQ